MQVMIARLKRRDQWDSALQGVFQFVEFRKAFWLIGEDPAAPLGGNSRAAIPAAAKQDGVFMTPDKLHCKDGLGNAAGTPPVVAVFSELQLHHFLC
jgi:hypothetical protein